MSKIKTKLGELNTVVNTLQPKLNNEAETYVAVWVEDVNGFNQRCIMLTSGELLRAERRGIKNIEDQTELVKPKAKNWFQKLFNL